jgi:hypothetical protein
MSERVYEGLGLDVSFASVAICCICGNSKQVSPEFVTTKCNAPAAQVGSD